MFKRLPSPAMVVACVALFVAMGGTGYAATQLATGQDQATASRGKRKAKGKRGKRGPAGPAGATGPAGPAGAPGSAKAWAVVYADGRVRKSFNVTGVTRTGVGLYCIAVGNGIGNDNSAALATLDWSDINVSATDNIAVASETAFNSCPDPQFQVLGFDSTGALADIGFSFMIP
jgi:hypothetical protein